MSHTISFQYMENNDPAPRAGYEFTDGEFKLPAGASVPRIGEFLQLVTGSSSKSYVVLAVHTRIVMLDPNSEPGWHTYVTVGPESEVADPRLLHIRE
jgi:hypothetical protein